MKLLEIQAGESFNREPLAINLDHILMVRPNAMGRTTIELTDGEELDVFLEYLTLVNRLKSLNHV